MNWTWSIRAGDSGMNGLEFCYATTAGDLTQVLVHAAPAQASVEVRDGEGRVVAAGDVSREGERLPMTLLTLRDGGVHPQEVWPGEQHHGTVVLLAGGEVGVLTSWQHSDDRSWWRWTLELSNHEGQPDDWSPPPAAAEVPPRRPAPH